MYKYIDLRDFPNMKEEAAGWFSHFWGVPKEAYLECMNDYLNHKNDYGWFLALDEDDTIIGGLGVIENDFHNRKDLAPNVCAVYVEEKHRHQGIAGHLLNMVVEVSKERGISPLYLLTDHTGFYERYGWGFFLLVQGNDEDHLSRMYIHR